MNLYEHRYNTFAVCVLTIQYFIFRHLNVSLDLLLKLVRMYGSPIYSSLSAPASVGVDIEAEQRLAWFLNLISAIMYLNIDSILSWKHV